MRLSGKRGDQVSLHFSEEINRETRELDPFTNRSARATDTLIFAGEGVEEFEPRFTYHGFRYVEVAGWDGPVLPGYFTACTLHCDFKKVGDFQCDDPSVNRLLSNILWGVRSNAVSYPTDCPMRDERTPCQHDVVVYFDIASQMFDAGLYFRRFAENTLAERGDCGWTGAQLTIAWFLYNWFGDKRYIEQCFNTLKTYVHNCEQDYPEICDKYFGDWCAPKDNADGGYECAFSYVAPTCTALMYYQTWEYCQLAEAMGEEAEVAWAKARMAWCRLLTKSISIMPKKDGMTKENRPLLCCRCTLVWCRRKSMTKLCRPWWTVLPVRAVTWIPAFMVPSIWRWLWLPKVIWMW